MRGSTQLNATQLCNCDSAFYAVSGEITISGSACGKQTPHKEENNQSPSFGSPVNDRKKFFGIFLKNRCLMSIYTLGLIFFKCAYICQVIEFCFIPLSIFLI